MSPPNSSHNHVDPVHESSPDPDLNSIMRSSVDLELPLAGESDNTGCGPDGLPALGEVSPFPVAASAFNIAINLGNVATELADSYAYIVTVLASYWAATHYQSTLYITNGKANFIGLKLAGFVTSTCHLAFFS